jgi:hypothetical protein
VARFIKKYGLVYRLGTRESQRSRDEVDAEGRVWVKEISEKLQQEQYSQDYTINMDQSAVYFSMHEKRTLSVKGVRTIFLRKPKDDSKRVTVAFTITASGLQLKPMIVFKGECHVNCELFVHVC